MDQWSVGMTNDEAEKGGNWSRGDRGIRRQRGM